VISNSTVEMPDALIDDDSWKTSGEQNCTECAKFLHEGGDIQIIRRRNLNAQTGRQNIFNVVLSKYKQYYFISTRAM
jgi:hypothetical protein